MRHVLSLKGDCDTNAPIVRGLLGAYWGIRKVPPDMVHKVMTYNYEKHGGQRRPDWLSSHHLPGIVRRLYEAAPDQLLKKD